MNTRGLNLKFSTLAFAAWIATLEAIPATLQPISVASGTNTPAAGNSFLPKVSSGGSRVLFLSHAKNLVTNDDQREWLDVFAHIPGSNSVLVSVNTNGVGGGNGNSTAASFVRNDSNSVVSASDADDLVTNDFNGGRDIFLRDLATQQTRLISVGLDGNAPVDPMPSSIIPLSANPIGVFAGVFFESRATNLVSTPVATNAVNIYVRQGSTTRLVSVDTNGNPFTNYCELVGVSEKGYVVAFIARSGLLPSSPSEIYVRKGDSETNKTTIHVSAAVAAYGSGYRCSSPQLDTGGDNLCFLAAGLPVGTVLFKYTFSTGTTEALATNVSEQHGFSVSPFLPFSDGTNIWRFQNGTQQLVSASTAGSPLTNGISREAVACSDFRTVLFISNSPELTSDHSTNFQLYARDMNLGLTWLVTRDVGGNPSAGLDLFTTLSLDRSWLAFDTTAAGLAVNDANNASDIFTTIVDGPVPKVTLALLPFSTQIRWSGDPARAYRVEYRDASMSGSWTQVSTVVSWFGNSAMAVDYAAPPEGTRFYRVVRDP